MDNKSNHQTCSVGDNWAEMWVQSIIASLWRQEFPASDVNVFAQADLCVMFSLRLWRLSSSARRGKLQRGDQCSQCCCCGCLLLVTSARSILLPVLARRFRKVVIAGGGILSACRPHNTFSLCSHPTLWRPEYGSYMIEGTPGQPYGGTMSEFNTVEGNMGKRRREASSVLNQNQTLCTITSFPMYSPLFFWFLFHGSSVEINAEKKQMQGEKPKIQVLFNFLAKCFQIKICCSCLGWVA